MRKYRGSISTELWEMMETLHLHCDSFTDSNRDINGAALNQCVKGQLVYPAMLNPSGTVCKVFHLRQWFSVEEPRCGS